MPSYFGMTKAIQNSAGRQAGEAKFQNDRASGAWGEHGRFTSDFIV